MFETRRLDEDRIKLSQTMDSAGGGSVGDFEESLTGEGMTRTESMYLALGCGSVSEVVRKKKNEVARNV